MTRTVLLLLALWLVAGCSWLGLSGLEVESVALSAQKPSNVAVYLWAADGDEPLTELALGDFRVYENDKELDPSEIDLVLLDRSVAAEHHTLLLVDMSGESDEERRAVAKAVPAFVQKVRRAQGVTVYAFAGSARPTLIGEFASSEAGAEPASLPRLDSFQPRDTSRDLHSAILEGLEQLDARLMRARKPLRIGTLLVFARGPDLAGRVTENEVQTALDDTPHQVFALSVGEPEDDSLSWVGRDGLMRAHAMNTLGIAFEDAAGTVHAALERYYLLSYCSPARAGTRTLRVEVSTVDSEGEPQVGDVQLEFDATGFGPGCDSRATPSFVVQTPRSEPGEAPGAATGGLDVGTPAKPEESDGNAGADDTAPAEEPGPGETGIVPPPDRPGYAPE